MDLYQQLDQETNEMLLNTLAERTLSGKQQWETLDYGPISLVEENEKYEKNEREAFLCQLFELETEFNGRTYRLELMEQILIPSEKGDISGTLTYDNGQRVKYDFALSFDDRYEDALAEQLKEMFADAPAVKLAEAVASVFEGSETADFAFACAGYLPGEFELSWKQMPLVKLGKKLSKEKRIIDFHRIVLDVEYRKKLTEQ